MTVLRLAVFIQDLVASAALHGNEQRVASAMTTRETDLCGGDQGAAVSAPVAVESSAKRTI